MEFIIIQKSKNSLARIGVLGTPHGKAETPCFVTVGTKATVKALGPDDLEKVGTQIVLANTYHLYTSKTYEIIKKAGGLNNFMHPVRSPAVPVFERGQKGEADLRLSLSSGKAPSLASNGVNWSGITMTDSGGFQVFSLGFGKDHEIGRHSTLFPGEDLKKMVKAESIKESQHIKILDEGVLFRLPDGSRTVLTPEKSIEIQEAIGADIMFSFDECTSPLASKEYTQEAVGRTHRWAERCLKAKTRNAQALWGIVQGGEWDDLRKESVETISSMPFDGFGLGGAMGKTKERMFELIEFINTRLPENKPRHLLGIGYPEDIPEIIKLGVDTFDCVAPTREARNGTLYIKGGPRASGGRRASPKHSGRASPIIGIRASPITGIRASRLSIQKSEYREDFSPIEEDCECFTCQNFSRAYLYHLYRERELLFYRLASIHNLYFINNLVADIRERIKSGEI